MKPPIESVLDLLQHYPRRYHDRTRKAEIAELVAGEEATIVAEVKRVSLAPDPAAQEDGRGGRRGRHRAAQPRLLQPAVARTPARRRYRGRVVREARPLPGQATAGEPDRRRARAGPETRRPGSSCRSTRSRARPTSPPGRSRRWSAWRSTGPATLADPLPADLRAELKDLPDRTWSYRHVHQPTSGRDARRGPAPPALRRVPPDPAAARAAQARDRGRAGRDRARGRRRADRAVPRRAPVRPDRGPDARARRDPARPREPRPDAPVAPGRGRIGQDRGGDRRAARRGAGRLPGRADGADRGARRAALLGRARVPRRLDRAERGLAARGSSRRRHAADEQDAARPSAGGSPPVWPRARSTSSSARTRSCTATRRSRSSGSS